MRMPITRYLLATSLITGLSSCSREADQAPSHKEAAGPGTAIAQAVKRDANAMKVLRQNEAVGSEVSIRTAKGRIPGTSGGGEDAAIHALLYGRNSNRAVLISLLQRRNGGLKVLEVSVLEQRNGRWTTIEANGGAMTYDALALYARDIEATALRRSVGIE